MSQDKDELLNPCPFCGGEAKIYNLMGIFRVSCDSCGCGTRYLIWKDKQGKPTQEELNNINIKAWNTRTPNQTVEKGVEMKKFVETYFESKELCPICEGSGINKKYKEKCCCDNGYCIVIQKLSERKD